MSLLAILSVFALIWVGFRHEPWFPDPFRPVAFGGRDVTPLTDAHMAAIIARAGGGQEPVRTFDRAIHRTSWGVRLLTPFLVAAAVAALRLPGYGTEDWLTGPAAWGLGALLLYPVVNVWVHRIEIDCDTISIMTPLFTMREYELRDLVDIHEDGPYGWKFRFANRRRAYALKTLVGAEELRHRLGAVLEANAR